MAGSPSPGPIGGQPLLAQPSKPVATGGSATGIAIAGIAAGGVSGSNSPRPPRLRLPRLRLGGDNAFLSFLRRQPSPPRPVEVKPVASTPKTVEPKAKPREPAVTEPPIPDYTLADRIIVRQVERASERPGSGVDLAKAKRSGGFRSKAEWKAYFVNPALRAIAHRRAHESKGGPKTRYRVLPERKA